MKNFLQIISLLGILALLALALFGPAPNSGVARRIEPVQPAQSFQPSTSGTSDDARLDALLQQVEQMVAQPPETQELDSQLPSNTAVLPTAVISPALAPIIPTRLASSPPSAAVGEFSGEFVDDCLRAAVEGRRSHPRCKEAIEQLGTGR